MPDTSDHLERSGSDQPSTSNADFSADGLSAPRTGPPKRRRGSRGGKNRKKTTLAGGGSDDATDGRVTTDRPNLADQPELPDLPWEGQPDAPATQTRPVRPSKPKIGDSIPGPVGLTDDRSTQQPQPERSAGPSGANRSRNNRKRQPGERRTRPSIEATAPGEAMLDTKGALDTNNSAVRRQSTTEPTNAASDGKRRRGRGRGPVNDSPELDVSEARKGRERNGKPVGRYLMSVHVRPSATQIAVLEGRSLIEHYVSQAINDSSQIHGNIYLGRVQNVLPGMEAAFVDIGTPKNAVLYRSDVAFDSTDLEGTPGTSPNKDARIEQLLKNGQLVVCQVTKNPIGQKGARLTQEVSLPGRFVVLVPNSGTYGISKRLPDDERKRLRRVLDEVRPAQHGIIVRTAASGASADELRRDVQLLVSMWEKIDAKAKKARGPVLLNREPDLAVRIIREEFNGDYRGIVIDDREVYEEVRSYVESISPELADRVEYHDPDVERLPIFEQYHVHEQLHKAIDRKVWLPSGGSLIIERTEALTVIDVNTGKNVGSTSLEETVYKNNLEAAQEIARQLRLRDIGGIIVIDFIDMEIRANRAAVVAAFREALSRDKTRSQVFEISELGLVEMTRKRISEGLVEALSDTCPTCNGRGFVFDPDILDE
jgi:ribonuclease E